MNAELFMLFFDLGNTVWVLIHVYSGLLIAKCRVLQEHHINKVLVWPVVIFLIKWRDYIIEVHTYKCLYDFMFTVLYSCICKFELQVRLSKQVMNRSAVKMKKPECFLLWHYQVIGGLFNIDQVTGALKYAILTGLGFSFLTRWAPILS